MKLSLLMVLVAVLAQIKPGSSCGESAELLSKIRSFGRITGGEDVKGCSVIPWQVYLLIERTGLVFICGGSLISDRHVLTAAHCLEHVRENLQVEVYLGTHETGSHIEHRNIKNLTRHQNYDSYTRDKDIAILTLEQPVEENRCVQPICLNPKLDFNGKHCIVSGWGDTDWNGHRGSPKTLQMATVKTYDGDKCQREFDIPNDYYIRQPERMICAGLKEGGRDACYGDGGGPLVCPDGDRFVQVGIVSHGHRKCGERGFPGIYTRVSFFNDWIAQVMRENSG